MLRSSRKLLKRGFRVQYNCDLLPPQPALPPIESSDNAYLYFNGESREGATAGEVCVSNLFEHPHRVSNLAKFCTTHRTNSGRRAIADAAVHGGDWIFSRAS